MGFFVLKTHRKMRIIYPFNPFNNHEADIPYQQVYMALQKAGLPCSLFDFDSFERRFQPTPAIQQNE